VKVGQDASHQCNFGAPTSQSFEIEAFMPKKVKPRSYDEVLTQLRNLKFDVREVPGVANQVQVSKHGAAAVLTRAKEGSGVAMVTKPGILFGGEIAHLLDRGFQKFFKTKHIELPAAADRLKAENLFKEELREVIGEPVLYNEALGSVSDEYMYDRVKGRDTDGPKKGPAPWELAAGVTGGH
jgi:hypothetical protein